MRMRPDHPCFTEMIFNFNFNLPLKMSSATFTETALSFQSMTCILSVYASGWKSSRLEKGDRLKEKLLSDRKPPPPPQHSPQILTYPSTARALINWFSNRLSPQAPKLYHLEILICLPSGVRLTRMELLRLKPILSRAACPAPSIRAVFTLTTPSSDTLAWGKFWRAVAKPTAIRRCR